MKHLIRWINTWRWAREYEQSLNRRAQVEQVLFDVANGKRDLLSKKECWDLAMKLGVSEKWT